MTENQTIKDRLLLFIREREMSVYAFEKQCGLSQGYVKNLGKSISTDKLGKITQHFPILSPSWLMFGEGSMYYNEIDLAADMIRSKAEREQQAHEPAVEYGAKSECVTCPFREQLAEKDRQIASLQEIINNLTRK